MCLYIFSSSYDRNIWMSLSNLFVVFLSDPYEDHSGSLRLITIKPMTAQPTYSYPSSSSHSQDSVVLNGEVSLHTRSTTVFGSCIL